MYRCLCCNYKTLPKEPKECIAYGCPVCYWENDAFMKDIYDLNERSDSNRGMTLQEAKNNFKKYGACMEEFVKYVREPIE